MPYSDEFKAEAVALVRSSDEPVSVVARQLEVSASTLRRWVADAPPPEAVPVAGSNAEAVELALRSMTTGPEHAAMVQSVRALAARLDYLDGVGAFDDKAWREYRLAWSVLWEATKRDGTDPYDEFLKGLRTPVGDTSDSDT